MTRERASVQRVGLRKRSRAASSTAKRMVAGLWIDHRRAVVVSMTNRGETTRLILSSVDKQLGRFAGRRSTTPYEAQLVKADERQGRRFQGHLAIYYDAVLAATSGAEALLVFGPGEAKVELRQRLAKAGRSRQIVGFETIDKMTDRQIASKVWQHFAPTTPGASSRPAAPTTQAADTAVSRAARR